MERYRHGFPRRDLELDLHPSIGKPVGTDCFRQALASFIVLIRQPKRYGINERKPTFWNPGSVLGLFIYCLGDLRLGEHEVVS
jgi:hypothetical protein